MPEWVMKPPIVKDVLAELLGPPVPVKRIRPERLTSGYLAREPKSEHVCRTPGWLSRTVHRVKLGSCWGCACGQDWEWTP